MPIGAENSLLVEKGAEAQAKPYKHM
jgi:hypothetical protein